ncbi:dihydrodipicolinate synthase family protein [Streptomyces inhibens]|uniref:dihydrodipicolinate synthase family protein n=1 Tax=Streptomyces inhibens TaxID=2293571 RepID=UPI00402AB6BA
MPPLCTPLTESGQVDVRSPAALVEHLVGAGVDGLFVLGSTGEAACLSDIQRRTVIETVVDAARGRLPVLAGAVDMATAVLTGLKDSSGDEGARRLLVRIPAAGRDFSVLIDCPATAAPQLPLDAAANRTVRRLLEEAGLL